MSKKRKISSFDEVANNSNIKNENENNENNILKNVLEHRRPKGKTHVFKGFYLEREVAALIDRLTDDKPKGTKSDLVNEILKEYFKREGIME